VDADNFATLAFQFAALAFNSAAGTGDQAKINAAYDLYILAFYGYIAIDGSGASNTKTPYFSILGFDFSSASYQTPGSLQYSEDISAGGGLNMLAGTWRWVCSPQLVTPSPSTPFSTPSWPGNR
jgi:hypothetical protein